MLKIHFQQMKIINRIRTHFANRNTAFFPAYCNRLKQKTKGTYFHIKYKSDCKTKSTVIAFIISWCWKKECKPECHLFPRHALIPPFRATFFSSENSKPGYCWTLIIPLLHLSRAVKEQGFVSPCFTGARFSLTVALAKKNPQFLSV